MLILTETIPPPRRHQIFNDYPEEDAANAALKKREEDDRWLRQFIKALAGVIRRVGK
jgi:hypothetical protein